jgi:hypothetical protein
VLVELAGRLASEECRWLGLLAEFDRRRGWELDGQLTAVDWLVWRCGFSRVTAREKLRVALALQHRPRVREAFAAGDISYSKVRAITRIEDADDETDERLLELARVGTATDLERAVRRWSELRDQERGMDDYLRRFDRRRLHLWRTFDGMMVVEAVLPLEEGEEVAALLAAAEKPQPVDSAESTGQRRVDALLALLRAGRAGAGDGGDSPGADRTMVHLVAEVDVLAGRFGGRAELLDGTPVGLESLRRLACDCSLVRHLVNGQSEPLDVGRRTRVWTAAQRRAISVRDHGRCRWPGCWRRTCDVHHVVHYERGGPTSVDNGILLCPRHHTCVHEGGFRIRGEPNGVLSFRRPDGTPLESSV